MKKKIVKTVSVFIALNMLVEIFSPTVAFALTGGPSQPEVESFEPIGTTQMVDMFSGDFNYNIPLMTVPGPNGGYPINLAYHAGIGMEQEASWVGLGWNINPGVINREMRGIPDDFNGDKITKELSHKPSFTAAISGAKSFEIFGKDIGIDVGTQFFWNNYKGIGRDISIAFVDKDASHSHFSPSLKLNYNSDGGLGISPGISYTKKLKENANVFHLGFDYNSKEGLTGINLNAEKRERENVVRARWNENKWQFHFANLLGNQIAGAGVSFSGSSFVPNVNTQNKGFNVRGYLSFGSKATLPDYKKNLRIGASYSQNSIKETEQTINAYGYMNSDIPVQGQTNVMMDFNREKDVPVNKTSPRLPMPVFTNDVYYVKGQGIGSVFRPYRSDYGVLFDNTVFNHIPGGNFSLEYGAGAPKIHIGGDFGMNYSESHSGGWSSGLTNLDAFYKEINNVVFKGSNDVTAALYEPYYFKSSGEQAAVNPARNNLIPLDENPVRFNVGRKFGGNSIKPKIEDDVLTDETNTSGHINGAGGNYTEARETRVQSVQKRMNNDIIRSADFESSRRPKHLYPAYTNASTNPYLNPSSAAAFDYTFNSFNTAAPERTNHIGEISMINPDGNKYIYSIPVYNIKQREVSFSINSPETDIKFLTKADLKDKLVAYTPGTDNSLTTARGNDHYFQATEIPPYVHSYLLTAIVSPDYVDLTGNGPSEDDLGYYVKFNYTKTWDESGAYKWRIPVENDKANSSKGYLSNLNDDMASYTYGEKEIYYLNSIETKTHIAAFKINDIFEGVGYRKDGLGVTDENGDPKIPATFSESLSNTLASLQEINLYSKKDLIEDGTNAKAIKTVKFEYNYELCPGIPNIKSTTGEGKLTLKKVWFSYLGNDKGALSPYVFDYHASTAGENPDYSLNDMDRWGFYQPSKTTPVDERENGLLNEENPYTHQSGDYDRDGDFDADDETARHRNASVWNLKKITLPSGGEINITYEADDYAYVQNVKAQQMMRVTGCGSTYNSTKLTSAPDIAAYNFTNMGRVYFELESPISSQAELNKYVEGLDKIYFKTFLKLKKAPATTETQTYDYVTGYARLKKDNETQQPIIHFDPSQSGPAYTRGYIVVEPEYVLDFPTGAGMVTHPFRKAGWQYLKLQRSDLFDQPNNPKGNILDFIAVIDVIRNSIKLLTGYYNYANIVGYCNEIVCVTNTGTVTPSNVPYFRPSYIRLNTPDNKKFGGGHRVKQITINDNWNSMDANQSSFDYGQQYTYALADGTSSGVAEYEPLIGGDEIALRYPLKYSSPRFLVKDNALYTEEPYGESYYPGAGVGYSRVIVRSLKRESGGNEINQKTATGYTVNEFYTAKDFPVNVDETKVDYKKAKFVLPIIIPFVGKFSYNNRGYSQGYKIELNDMHGKMKSMATYSSYANVNDPTDPVSQPITKVEYIYKSESNPDKPGTQRLNNNVDVLYADGYKKSAVLARSSEFFVDMREHSAVDSDTQVDVNTDATTTPPAAIATLIPDYTYSESMFRSIVTNKIINKNGILIETRNYNDGALVATKNLLFDSETGVPLLTQVTNEFDAPVYNYTLPSHWAYDNMGAAYKNVGAYFGTVSISTGGIISAYPTPSQYFVVGDKIEAKAPSTTTLTPYWVTTVDDNAGTVTLINEQGNAPGAGSYAEMRISQSGRRNQQSINAGSIVSLADPVTERNSLFKLYNLHIKGATTLPASFSDLYSCTSNDVLLNAIAYDYANKKITFTILGDEPQYNCNATLTFPANAPITANIDFAKFSLQRAGNKVIATDETVNPKVSYNAIWDDGDGCFPECMSGVLQAQASQFKDVWTYNYADVGSPVAQQLGAGSTVPLATAAAANPYRFGARNIWRMERSNAYLVDRKQTPTQTNIAEDGTFNHFVFYNWTDPLLNPNWTYVNEVTRYSPYGFELENKDAIGIFSSALYGYDNSLVTSVSKNTSYFENGFDGFEDHGSSYSSGHGHINLFVSGTTRPSLSASGEAHTGKHSISIPSVFSAAIGQTNPDFFNPQPNKKYVVSAWFKPASPSVTQMPEILISGATINKTTIDANKIEGWRRMEVEFTTGASGTVDFTFRFDGNCCDGYVDDLRIMPFKSAITTYVYDPKTLWLIAELDNRNFATLYNYDEEGSLVQVKKETINGIVTLRTSRNNIKRP